MRIALATVGTAGDVRPFATLAAALAARGHDVTAISWKLHRPAFAASGARFEAAGPPTSAEEIRKTAERAAAAKGPIAQVAVLRDFHLRDAVPHYRQLRTLLPEHDLVVMHGIHSLAQAAADDTGTPWASAVFDPVLLPTRSAPPAGMPNLGPLNPLAWRLLDRMLRPLDAPLHAALAEAGSSVRPTLFRSRSAWLHLVACSPSIVAVPADLPRTTHVTGAWPPTGGEPLPTRLVAFLEAGDAPIVVSFGSMAGSATARLHDAVAAAARALGRRVVTQGGSMEGDDVLAIGEVDHRLLFPRAAAVVHHGGAGTTHAVVVAGVPSVVIPHVGDQRYGHDGCSASASPLRRCPSNAQPTPRPSGHGWPPPLAATSALARRHSARASAVRRASTRRSPSSRAPSKGTRFTQSSRCRQTDVTVARQHRARSHVRG